MSTGPDLAVPTRAKGMAHAYRLMVDAVQAGDLAAASQAYGSMMEDLSRVGVGADDTLAKIGVCLRQGDLETAKQVLDRLESRALRVLRGLREHADFARQDAALQPLGKLN
ncbi:hypothetical protein [Dongia sp. agr-C8]